MVQRKIATDNPVPVRATTQSGWTTEAKQQLVGAVDRYDLPSKAEWSGLAELSSATEFEGIQVFAEDAIFEGDGFVAPATVYLKLTDKESSGEPIEFSDSFPASVMFDIDPDGSVNVSRIEVDTSSFFVSDDV